MFPWFFFHLLGIGYTCWAVAVAKMWQEHYLPRTHGQVLYCPWTPRLWYCCSSSWAGCWEATTPGNVVEPVHLQLVKMDSMKPLHAIVIWCIILLNMDKGCMLYVPCLGGVWPIKFLLLFTFQIRHPLTSPSPYDLYRDMVHFWWRRRSGLQAGSIDQQK